MRLFIMHGLFLGGGRVAFFGGVCMHVNAHACVCVRVCTFVCVRVSVCACIFACVRTIYKF